MSYQIVTFAASTGGFHGIVKATGVWYWTAACYNKATAEYEAKKLVKTLFGKGA